MTRVRLADLEGEADVVELPDGTEAKVKRLDGVTAHMWKDFMGTPEDERDPTILWEIAGRCIPDVDQPVVDSLTASQVTAVIAVASGNVEKVLAALKNGERAEVKAPDTSSPEIPSVPSSAMSPEPPVEVPESSP